MRRPTGVHVGTATRMRDNAPIRRRDRLPRPDPGRPTANPSLPFITLSGSVDRIGRVTVSIVILLLVAWMVAAVAFALCAGRVISTADRIEGTSQDRDDHLETTRSS